MPSSRAVATWGQRSDRRAPLQTAITLELTDSQILSICEDAGAAKPRDEVIERLGQDLASLTDLLEQIAAEPQPRLSGSLLRGLFVLATLPSNPETVGVLELSKQLEMSASTLHRYLQTLLIAGLVRRDAKTREYGLAFRSR